MKFRGDTSAPISFAEQAAEIVREAAAAKRPNSGSVSRGESSSDLAPAPQRRRSKRDKVVDTPKRKHLRRSLTAGLNGLLECLLTISENPIWRDQASRRKFKQCDRVSVVAAWLVRVCADEDRVEAFRKLVGIIPGGRSQEPALLLPSSSTGPEPIDEPTSTTTTTTTTTTTMTAFLNGGGEFDASTGFSTNKAVTLAEAGGDLDLLRSRQSEIAMAAAALAEPPVSMMDATAPTVCAFPSDHDARCVPTLPGDRLAVANLGDSSSSLDLSVLSGTDGEATAGAPFDPPSFGRDTLGPMLGTGIDIKASLTGLDTRSVLPHPEAPSFSAHRAAFLAACSDVDSPNGADWGSPVGF